MAPWTTEFKGGSDHEPYPIVSFLLPSSRAVRSYRPHLEERDPIWDDDWSHSSFIRRSPSWRFLGDSLSRNVNARRSVHSPQDNFIITLIIRDRRDWRDTEDKWPLISNADRSWWNPHTSLKVLWPQPMAPWTTGINQIRWILFNIILTDIPYWRLWNILI